MSNGMAKRSRCSPRIFASVAKNWVFRGSQRTCPAHYHSAIERVGDGLQVIRNLAVGVKHSDSWKTVNDRVNEVERAMLSGVTRPCGFQGIFPGKPKVRLRNLLYDKAPKRVDWRTNCAR